MLIEGYENAQKCYFSPPEPLSMSCLSQLDTEPDVYFDSQLGECIDVKFNKCARRIKNGFDSRKECLRYCLPIARQVEQKHLTEDNAGISSTVNEYCNSPADYGTGGNYLVRFHYSRYHGRCLRFIYSGAGGNSNNFLSMQHCRRVCM